MADQPELDIPSENKTLEISKEEKEAYRERLRAKLKDPEFRKIEGFPIGEDEDILALSDPPFYTACPNPFMDEIIAKWQKERDAIRKELGLPDDSGDNSVGSFIYKREPFASDVSEGKNDPIYNAHSYHTKVPHKAIMRYILHYTDPGDIVLDGFCGSGMTGVAAQLCGSKKEVESLGYQVKNIDNILDEEGKEISKLGTRKSMLIDLCPAATFIAHNYNTPIDTRAFEKETSRILKEVEEECGWMYETWHPKCDDPNCVKGRINYTVWSDVFLCPHCGAEMVFWDVAVNLNKKSIAKIWECPTCHSQLSKQPPKNSPALKVDRSFENLYDRALGKTIKQAKQAPVLINYSVGSQRFEKSPDNFDFELLEKIQDTDIQFESPSDAMPNGSNTAQPRISHGFTHVHHFYTKRNLYKLSCFISFIKKTKWLMWFTSALIRTSKLYKFTLDRKMGTVMGTLYIPSINVEKNPSDILKYKIRSFGNLRIIKQKTSITSTNSITQTENQDSFIDYIFVDPPFGGNLMYSELNFIYESWLKVFTNNKKEAIINKEQQKKLNEYQNLMEECFDEYYRLLKQGRWITVEFHNSQNSVWTSIQEAILHTGFMIADVRTLDKQQDTFKQVTTTSAVKQDLIISAYKPHSRFEQQFRLEGGSEKGMWEFVKQHLEQLPMPQIRDGLLEPLQERMPFLLYDRMVAFHVQRGLTIPLSAADFYQGLIQKYLERDGMVFTPAQATQYDSTRLQAEGVEQLTLFITNEVSARQWIRQELDPKSGHGPQTYGELQPRFMQAEHHVSHEALPELLEILEQSFVEDNEERWYVPDPYKQADLEKLRTNALLREFNEYMRTKGKLRVFRSEAVRTGFSKAWHDRDYQTIVSIAERIPDKVLQEDANLLMYYQNAKTRLGEQPEQLNLI